MTKPVNGFYIFALWLVMVPFIALFADSLGWMAILLFLAVGVAKQIVEEWYEKVVNA